MRQTLQERVRFLRYMASCRSSAHVANVLRTRLKTDGNAQCVLQWDMI